MKTAIITLVLAHAMTIYAQGGKCCTRQAVNDQAYCQSNEYWASCCLSWSDANSGHGCDNIGEFPVGRQTTSPAYKNGVELQACQNGGIWYCYDG